MKDKILFYSAKLFFFIAEKIPASMIWFMAKNLASLLYRIDKRRKRIAEINLDFIYGESLTLEEKRNIVKWCYRNLVINLLDFAKNLKLSESELKERLIVKENLEAVQTLIAEGKKVIFITGHFGYWEILPFVCRTFFGKNITVVGRELGNKDLDALLKESRERMGVSLVSKQNAAKALVKSLNEGSLLGLVVDQNTAEKEGLLVDFFGKESRHTPIASNLAKRYDAAIVPAFVRREGEKYAVNFHPPIFPDPNLGTKEDIQRLTQLQARAVQIEVEKDPKEWFWFHRRWKNRYEEIYR